MAAFDFPNSPSNGQTYTANGMTFIWNGSVWKKDATSGVKGEKGQKGEKGEKGEKGQKGQKGEKGETGQKGQKGEDNSTKGQKGQQGDKGQKGEQGLSGGGGDKGEPGDKGQKGEQNDKGQKGDVGADNSTKGQKGEDNSTKGQKGEVGAGGDTGIPSGFIGLWSGNSGNIPSGWYLCDGNNSTPDLRDKFVIGASAGTGDTSYPGLSPSASGGSADATLVSHSHTFSGSGSHSHTINNHTHSFSGSGSSSHTHGIPKGRGGSQASITNYVPSPRVEQDQASFSSDSATVSISIIGTSGNPSDRGTDSQSVSISGTTNSPGSSATNANLPPYYALCYIMKS